MNKTKCCTFSSGLQGYLSISIFVFGGVRSFILVYDLLHMVTCGGWLLLTRFFWVTLQDLSYIPTTNEKTVTYRRDRPPDHPVEMHIQVPKMPLGDPWRY